MKLAEPMHEMFSRSRLLVLDFSEIADGNEHSIKDYFEECERSGINPRLPENRQRFNDQLLARTGARYLISRYAEDRIAMLAGSEIAREGRTIHMGVDMFSTMLETIYAPCDGRIVETGLEDEPHGYGHYLIMQPDGIEDTYFFFGHLSRRLPAKRAVKLGDAIANLGDYVDNENGGWSRHLHFQVLKDLPEPGQTPQGYATKANFSAMSKAFPDPMPYFPDWEIAVE